MASEPKLVFLVPTVALVQQQWRVFKEYLPHLDSIPMSGEASNNNRPSMKLLIKEYDIFVMTPQILMDALEDEEVASIMVFSMLVFDECHHAMKGHPYSRIMAAYHDARVQAKDDHMISLPQVPHS